MIRLLWLPFFMLSAAGLLLPFLPPASWPWWDATWCLVFFVAAYASLVRRVGLQSARLSAGVIILSLAVLLGTGALTGWPVGPLRFTEHAGLRLGGAIPLVIPLFAFALLSSSHWAAEAALPSAGRPLLALATAAAFLISLINGIPFLEGSRLWWLWNPWEDLPATGRGASSIAVLAAASFALAFCYAPDHRMKPSRWTAGALAWIAVNILFLAAHLPKPGP